MSRGIHTVPDVWREWDIGLALRPAIKDLERQWRTTWCQGNERRFFNRRKILVDAITSRMEPHQVSAESAALWLD
ncbi:transcriptional activator of glycolytic enzymes-domain-containing protein, partial [Phlyctochytrium arcticum]